MNAVIDIGNTKTKVGLFEIESKLNVFILDTNDIAKFLKEKEVLKVLVSNVGTSTVIDEIKNTNVQLNVLDVNTPMPISTNYTTPQTLGVDRLAACVGGRKHASGNLLVIDAGTCITYDILTAQNIHLGGIISPGLTMRLKAMHTLTAALPLVPTRQVSIIGNSTEKSMQSGASNGAIAEMKGLILKFQEKYQDLSIIIGGGDAVFFDKNMELNTFVVSNLGVEGLHAIFKYNE